VIIDRYLIKEVLMTFLGVVFILLMIALSGQLASLFSKVVEGTLTVDAVLTMFGLKLIVTLAQVLPLSFFLGILLAFSRLYNDSEMVVLTACGMGQFRVLRSILGLAIVIALLEGAVTLVIAPWAEVHTQKIYAEVAAQSDVDAIIPGRFKEIDDGGIIYIEGENQEKTLMDNLFVQQNTDGKKAIISAASGRQYIDADTGDKFVVLNNGSRYEGKPGQLNFAIIKFKEYGVRIKEKDVAPIRYKHYSSPTLELYRSKNIGDKAELQSRISSILLCIVLALIAVPLSRTSPRQGRYAKLAIALLLYITYTNLLNVARAWIIKGDISTQMGLWWVHAIMIIISLLMLFQQTGFKHYFQKQPNRSHA